MPFSEKSLRFLDENHERNSREWFTEHKDVYKEHVEAPMLALARSLVPVLLDLDPLLTANPNRALSRIWRDTRFSRDKTVFKRASWFVFQRSKGMVHPVWFFEFSPDFFRYGCGYYMAPPKVMALLRELVLANDKRYRAAQKALDSLPGFSLDGDRYKRPKYPDTPVKQRDWLERKSIAAMLTSADPAGLYAENLAETVGKAFIRLAPVYDFLIYAHETAQEQSGLARSLLDADNSRP